MDATDSGKAHSMNTIFILARLKAKGESPFGESNPQPCALQTRFGAALASSYSSGLVLPTSGIVAERYDRSGTLRRSPFS